MKKKTASRPPRSPRKKRVQFNFEAPDAQSVMVTGTFSGWQQPTPLKKDKKGLWKTTLTLEPGRHEYRFLVDGEWRDDPQCGERVPNQFGGENCVVHV